MLMQALTAKLKRIIFRGAQALASRANYQLLPRPGGASDRLLLSCYGTLEESAEATSIRLGRAGKVFSSLYLQQILRRYPIDLCVDVGANEGQFAASMRELGYRRRLVSIEPIPWLAQELIRKSRNDPNWCIIEGLVALDPGEREFHIFSSSDFSSLHSPSTLGMREFGQFLSSQQLIRAQAKRLDSWFEQEAIPLPNSGRILLKSDTQGSDLEVLQGAGEILSHAAIVLVEVSYAPIYSTEASANKIISFLAENGFKLAGLFPIAFTKDNLDLIEADAFFIRA
jgi:FkbM family methyltransferase